MTEGIGVRRAPPRQFGGLGLVPGLLLGAAVAHLLLITAVQVAIGQSSLSAPAIVVGHLTEAMSFVLAGAVMLGIGRWPRARPWLVAGAIVLVVQGLLDIALQAWFWWTFSLDPFDLPGLNQTFVWVRGVASLLTTIAAPALLAAGMLASPATSPGNPARRRAVALLALLGLAAVTIGTGLAVVVAARSPIPAFELVDFALSGIGLAGLAALGGAAVHRLPAHYRMPELLIAIGAGLAVANGVWQSIMTLSWVLQGFGSSFGWLQTVPNVLGLIGLIAVALGFAVGRIVPPRGARPPERP